MSNLLTALTTAGRSLGVYQQALDVIQNNITNSTTPGYAKQSLKLTALPMDTAGGFAGGVAARGLDSARSEFADEEVRRQLQSLGRYQAQSQAIASIENLFDVSGDSGIPADLNVLFQSFSAWSVSPASGSARQSVMAGAQSLAGDIRSLAGSLGSVAKDVQGQIGSTVSQINQLAAAIQRANVQRRQEASADPGLDANLHNDLEQLSELVDITTVSQAEGTISVMLKSGSPLVVGDNLYSISSSLSALGNAANPNAPPSSQILDWQGADISGQIQGGTLGGLLDVRNRVLPLLIGDGQQAGYLNQFASSFADAVNQILESGSTGSGLGAGLGSPLFAYDATDATSAARTFALNPNLTADGLAPVDAAGNSNGNALQLAALADDADALGAFGYVGFFSEIAAAVGRDSASAQTGEQAQSQVVTQTRALRDKTSSVSLDEQAILLLQFQRSYQAVAKLLTTIDGIMDSTLNLIR
jgi:flagellar hook-associated protein 1